MKDNTLKNKYPYNLLTEYFLDVNDITKDTPYSIYEIEAKELIGANRIDLMAKMAYIDFKERKICCDFGKELYCKHIEAFSNGTYKEPGTPEKNSIEKYLNDFDNIINTIKKNGFDSNISLVPIGENNEVLDGSHRVSAAAYYNKKITVIKFEDLCRKYDYNFFKERLLQEEYLDYMINEYLRLKENIYVACIWPKANNNKYKEDINAIINERCNIVCSKEISLTYNGLRNLMIQIYGHQNWIGDYKNHFKGVISKVDSCYEENKKLKVYILESHDFNTILNLKQKIRNLVSIENHSIHITDNKKESIQIGKLLFNKNSINHLNTSYPDKYSNHNKRLHKYKENIINNNLDIDDFIVDSSGPMGTFGIRESNDLDFLSLSDKYKLVEDDGISNNDDQLYNYSINKDSIIYNPNNYFVYNDLKFITLDLLKNMKVNRNEIRDKEDVRLIEIFLRNNGNSYSVKVISLINIFRRRIRKIKFIIKENAKYVLKKIGVYNVLKMVKQKIMYS